jgi:pSer/pThr/pTyr-binding forkhead associated (FHA) protein
MFKLVISDDEGKTTTVPLVRDEITIGRKEGNTIRLTDRNVSRRHAKLQKRNGGYVLQDLGSYNGTVINGTRLSDQRALKMGDQIVIGDYKLNIVEENGAQVAPAAGAAPSAAVVETYEAPAQQPGHHPQATMPAIPTALGVPLPTQSAVPDHLKRLQLVFLAPPGTPSTFVITKVPVLLGRSELADVSLPFSSISREHAKIVVEDDKLVIEDLGSSNGVVVNGERVKKMAIAAGDQITMGVVECKLSRVGEATAIIPPVSAAVAEVAEPSAEPKKSSAGMLVGIGVLVAALGGGGAMYAMKNNNQQSVAQNTTVVTGAEPTQGGAGASTGAAQTANPAAPSNTAPQAGNTAPAQVEPGANPPANNGTEPTGAAAQPTTNSGAVVAQNTGAEPAQNAGSEPTGVDPPTQPTRTPSESGPRRARNSNQTQNTAPSNTPTVNTPPANTPTVTRPNPPTNPPAPSGAASGQNAGQCLLANNFQCAVDALRGRAATEIEFNQLVTAYRGLRNTAAAEQTMRRYLQRFPDGRYAERYRDTLGQ